MDIVSSNFESPSSDDSSSDDPSSDDNVNRDRAIRAFRKAELRGEGEVLCDLDPVIRITASSFDDAFPIYSQMHVGERDHLLQQDSEVLDEIALYLAQSRAEPCSALRPSQSETGRFKCTWGCKYSTNDRVRWEQHEANRQPQEFWHCVGC